MSDGLKPLLNFLFQIMSTFNKRICANHLKVPYSFGLLEISINLTEDGLEHVDEIIQLVFEYMTMLRNEGPKKWLFDEMTNIQDLDFRHGERQNARAFVIHLVHAMQVIIGYYRA